MGSILRVKEERKSGPPQTESSVCQDPDVETTGNRERSRNRDIGPGVHAPDEKDPSWGSTPSPSTDSKGNG